MKKNIARLWRVALWLSLVLTACTGTAGTPASTGAAAEPTVASTPVVYDQPLSATYAAEDLTVAGSAAAGTAIRLAAGATTVTGDGVSVDGNRVTITAGGTYDLSGELPDGQIVVDSEDEEPVVLVLNGVQLGSAAGTPLYVANAEKVVITLAAGTENFVTDGAAGPAEGSDAPDAAIYSHDDLTINGDGALTVDAASRHGIVSKDDLKITGGRLTVNAGQDGLRGRNSIAIKDGVITINAGADGLQSNHDEDPEKGTLVIEGGTLAITSGSDGVQAETRLLVSGGDLTITAGGGSANSAQVGEPFGRPGAAPTAEVDTGDSARGLQAGVELVVTGGKIVIDAADDTLHAGSSVTIGGGELQLASGDDGIHADCALTLNGGTLTITESYEGLESAEITVNDGTVRLTARDDGINVAGGNDGSAEMGGFGGRPDEFSAAGNSHLYLNGGYVVVDSGGDGLDCNGPIEMTGGTVLVNGPADNMNGALDYTGEFKVTGGLLVAVGSAGMAQAPSGSSTQYAALVNFSAAQAAGAPVHIVAADGTPVLTFVPTKAYQSVALCSPALTNGTTYQVYTGGSTTGTAQDGLYTDGAYTPGTSMVEFTVEGIVTNAGVAAGGFPGGPGGMPGERPGGPRP